MCRLCESALFSPRFYLFILIISISSYSCKYSKPIFTKSHKLEKTILNSNIFKNQFTGFVLFDIEKNKEVLNINGNKFFTPASNTKIITYYTSLMILDDSLPIINYKISNDSLIFWGTGNPINLNPDFTSNTYTIDFLKNRNEELFFCDDNFQDEKLGSGWAWDDYLYDYQLEKSSFPIFGNRLNIDITKDSIYTKPSNYKNNIQYVEDSNYYFRSLNENTFKLGKFKQDKTISIPLATNYNNTIQSIEFATGKTIETCPNTDLSKLKSTHKKILIPDSLYIRLLHNSDNFIAEQLILMCANELFDTLNTKKTLTWAKENLLPKLKNNSRWVDGSGLSRYNLFSPEDMVYTLRKIHSKITWSQIIKFFPAGGISGTLAKSYKNISKPYLYAKSGSLSNNYNLSGYIITKKGNKYIFSFMNNHFLTKSSSIKKEMEKVFEYIYEKY